jgi:hypothetical protein
MSAPAPAVSLRDSHRNCSFSPGTSRHSLLPTVVPKTLSTKLATNRSIFIGAAEQTAPASIKIRIKAVRVMLVESGKVSVGNLQVRRSDAS